jgi:hypothetical protein
LRVDVSDRTGLGLRGTPPVHRAAASWAAGERGEEGAARVPYRRARRLSSTAADAGMLGGGALVDLVRMARRRDDGYHPRVIGWIVVGFGFASAAALVASRMLPYRRVFSDRNFLEIAKACPRLKAAALDKPLGEDASALRPGDPRALLTGAGLALVYTIRHVETEVVHHCSVSFRGYTAHAVGATFTLLLVKLLGIPLDKASFAIGATTIHHMEASLSRDDHAAVAARSVPEVSVDDLTALRSELLAGRERVSWQVLRPAN